MSILDDIKVRARESPKRIVFPEGDDVRVLRACRIIRDENIGFPVILRGSKAKILLEKNNISCDGLELVDESIIDLGSYVSLLVEKRKHKSLSAEDAKSLVKDVNYLGVLMVESGFVDCMISGAVHPTASVLRPALQIIKTKPGVNTASSFFIVCKDDLTYFFSDCAFVINPDENELCDIALSTARSAETLGFSPRVALLSFSTKGSAEHESLIKIRNALSLIKEKNPGLVVDGELQLDSAIVPDVAKLKCGDSVIKGDANVLVFPDLNSGNIGYKLVERLGGFMAIGPIVQGLRKPVNDLSRGCGVDDIVRVAMITVVEVGK
ncbi:phosphate acetyltransferase [Candidatus Woesearchaeota archaeon]|nr:phosphate acetyltransferase [Candidatus Woesearchaeota archaeon]